MKITLISLKLTNFKSIRNRTINFYPSATNIYGTNTAGKTTLFDSFLWVLFGKDSTDRKDFEIKTLDENNEPFHKLDHEVEATLSIDGVNTTLRRCLREKWTKKRGGNTEEFTGHETTYYWNDVPMKLEEYNTKISQLVNEGVFKLLTNTTYFSAQKWQDRRATLLSIAGTISNEDVFNKIRNSSNNTFVASIEEALKQGKTVEEYKKQIAAQVKKIKDEMEQLPIRIGEANNSLIEALDYAALAESLATVKADIEGIDGLLQNKSAAYKAHQDEITNLLNKKQNLSRLCLDIEHNEKNNVATKSIDRQNAILTKERELKALSEQRQQLLNTHTAATKQRAGLKDEQDAVRAKWNSANEEPLTFNDADFCCPTCKRAFEAADVETQKQTLTQNFNENKSKALAQHAQRGQELGKQIEEITVKLENIEAEGKQLAERITTCTESLDELKKQHERLKEDEAGQFAKAIESNADYQKHLKEIAELETAINTPYSGEDNSALKFRKTDLQKQADEITKQLATEGLRNNQLARITELQDRESILVQELSSIEGIQFAIDLFEKEKMAELENRVNSRFKLVKFKMYQKNINGGEEPACITLINGVPYSDVNTAAKIQAGLDIINTLSEHYDVYAPVWIDNRESVIDLPESNSQIINLFVSEAHKTLTVEAEKVAAAV